MPATEEMRKHLRGALIAFREIGKPFIRLERGGKNSEKKVSSAKTVPKTPANLEFVGENSLTYEVYSVNIIVEKVLPIDGQPK